MLGVQRPTITNVLREFQRAGLVEPSRQRVIIRNRQGLIGESCECYELVRAPHCSTPTQNLPEKLGPIGGASTRHCDALCMRMMEFRCGGCGRHNCQGRER